MPPRPLRPKDEVSIAESSETASDIKPGKRRAVSSACIPCRKRKSKCDGNLPSCSTCVAVYRTECSYDADSDHRRKGALKRDLQSLQQRNDALDVIVASLRALPEPDAIALLQNLRSDTNPDVIAASLRSNVSPTTTSFGQTPQSDYTLQVGQGQSRSGASSAASESTSAEPLPQSSTNNTTTTNNSTLSPPDPPRLERSSNSESKVTTGRSAWFSTSLDVEYVDDLLDLYFCWVHPFYQFFSKDHFLFDFRNGRNENCSAALANAILSIASNYSDQAPARAQHPYSPQSVSDYFFNEAKTMLDRNDPPSLTMIQAFAVLSVRETSFGRESNAYQYAGRCVRLVTEMNLNLSVSHKSSHFMDGEVKKMTFWSTFNLETLTSVNLGRSSHLPRSAIDTAKPDIIERVESQIWRPYVHSSSNELMVEHTSNSMLFSNCFSELCELASDMINTFYAPKESFTSRKLAVAFAGYQEWYKNLPEQFWLENTSLPHVVVLHMCYHVYVLHLFRPYIKLELHAAKLYPRETCISSANEISNLMTALRSLYGLRRVSPAVVGMLYSASTIHLLNLPVETSAVNLEQAIHDMGEMSACHPYAQQCADNIRALAAKWNVTLPERASPTRSHQTNSHSAIPSPNIARFPWNTSQRQANSGGNTFTQEMLIKQEMSFFPNTFNQGLHQEQQQQQHLSDGVEDGEATTDVLQAQMPVWTPLTMPMSSSDMDGVTVGPLQTNQTDWSLFGMPSMGQQFQQQETRRQSAPEQEQNVDAGTSSSASAAPTSGGWQWER